MNKTHWIASAASAGLAGLFFTPAMTMAQVTIEEGLDAWQTDPCDGVIDLPPLPADFFGPGSEPVPAMDDFTFKGHPVPDVFGPPDPFPRSQTEVGLQWFDPHGTPVGPDSIHGVTSTPRIIIPDPPYNFDTVVRRKEDVMLDTPGAESTVPIEMTWLSLVSCEPITVTINGASTLWDVHVGLSENLPALEGRMKLDASVIRPGGGGSGAIELGDSTDQVNQEFEDGNFNYFNEDPDALGLPVPYQIIFKKQGEPATSVTFDDPTGQNNPGGIKTLALFTNDGNPDGEWRKREKGKVLIHPGIDAWSTPCDSFVAAPVTFGPGFFGPGSLPITAPEIRLEGWPFDFPFGPPPKFPDDQVSEMHVWLDQHGNVVGPDSAHKVSQSVIVVQPVPPYNFDTCVERLNGGLFCDPGDVEDIRLQFVWLSLRSCTPLVVEYDTGPPKLFWIHVGLSDRSDEVIPGRLRVTAESVDEAGGRFRMDLGKSGDPVDQAFEIDPLAFEFDPDHLGLPLYYQIQFVEEGTQEAFQVLDDPEGIFSGGQLPTIGLLHNELGGEMKVLQAVPGDANLDGRCDVFDIEDFITALIDPVVYREMRNANPNLVCDLNGDGLANAFDISPFVDVLTGQKTLPELLDQIQRGSLDRIFPVLGVTSDGWQVTASPPFGIPPITNIAQGLAALESPTVAVGNFDRLNFADPESNQFGAGHFLGDVPFPNNTQFDDNDFAMLAEATLVVPDDGPYDVGFLGNDGSFLTIDGQTFDEIVVDATGNATGVGTDTISCDCLTGNSHTVGRLVLPAGEHTIRAFLFERNGGANVEVFGGPVGAPKRLLIRDGAGFESLFDGFAPEVVGGPLPLLANPDLDGDGVGNLDELRAGTDPLDPSSYFRLESLSALDDTIELRWPSMLQLEYDVEFSESATPGSWQVVNEKPIAAQGETTSWIGPRPSTPSGFYRVSIRPLSR